MSKPSRQDRLNSSPTGDHLDFGGLVFRRSFEDGSEGWWDAAGDGSGVVETLDDELQPAIVSEDTKQARQIATWIGRVSMAVPPSMLAGHPNWGTLSAQAKGEWPWETRPFQATLDLASEARALGRRRGDLPSAARFLLLLFFLPFRGRGARRRRGGVGVLGPAESHKKFHGPSGRPPGQE